MGDAYLVLLGPPEVRHADQVVQFSTRKELALLIYLAFEDHVHARQHLSELFWPEADARHGRAALRTTLLHLRHLLDEDQGPDPVPHLLITRDALGLNLTSALDLDLHALHDAWTAAHASARTTLHLPDDAHRSLFTRLQRAASLPRGAFLEGFTLRDAPAFDDWVRFQRDSWHLRTSEVFDRLSHLQFEAGELASAMETVERWQPCFQCLRSSNSTPSWGAPTNGTLSGRRLGSLYSAAYLRAGGQSAGAGADRPQPPDRPAHAGVLRTSPSDKTMIDGL
jgi:DNA-binding SARP family transcriptional activator